MLQELVPPSRRPIADSSTECFLFFVFIQDHLFTEWINIDQLDNPEPIIDRSRAWEVAELGTVDWKVPLFWIKLKL